MVVLSRRRGWKLSAADVRLVDVERLESRVVLSALGGKLQEFLSCILNRDAGSPESSSECLPCSSEEQTSESCLELPPVVECLLEKVEERIDEIEERVEEIVEEIQEKICEIKERIDFLPDCESEPTTFSSESEQGGCDSPSDLGDRIECLLERVSDKICEIKSRLDICDSEPQTRLGRFLDEVFSKHDFAWFSCDDDCDEEEQPE